MISEIFKDILKNYTVKNHNVVLDNQNIVDRIENDYSKDFNEFISTFGDFNTEFSCLKGETLLRVPYAVIYSREYDDYNNGLFIGFSVYPDKGYVYLKLDQGLVNINGNFNLPFVRGEKLRSNIDDIPKDFEFNKNKCAPGNIIGKTYCIDDLDDSTIINDLNYIISVYNDLIPEFDEIITLSFDDIVDSIDL